MITFRFPCVCADRVKKPSSRIARIRKNFTNPRPEFAAAFSTYIGRVPRMGLHGRTQGDVSRIFEKMPALQPRDWPAHRKYSGPANSRPRVPSQERELERQLETELNETGVVDGGIDRAKTRGVEIRNEKAARGIRRSELRMVEEVEEFRPEIQAHVFPRQGELLDD